MFFPLGEINLLQLHTVTSKYLPLPQTVTDLFLKSIIIVIFFLMKTQRQALGNARVPRQIDK